MELKDGAVRIDDAAEWLSQKTGKRVTPDDLLAVGEQLPICALIPRSLANPKFSGAVQRAILAKAVDVEMDAKAARKGPLTPREIAEAAKRGLSGGIATRLEIEKTIQEEGIYLLSRRDLHLLARHGVQRLNRGTPFLSLIANRGFQPGLAEAIEFGTPVDVKSSMLCVLKGYLVKYAKGIVAQQPAAFAPELALAQKAQPTTDEHQEEVVAAPADTVLPKRDILGRLALRFPELESAWRRQDKWIMDARVKHGRYRLEEIEAGCRRMWPKDAPPRHEGRLTAYGQLSAIG